MNSLSPTNVASSDVRFHVDAVFRPGWLVLPPGTGPFPGVVVVHELFGLDPNIRRVTERFATHGYAALAVDLFAERSRSLCLARMLWGALTNAFDHVGIRELRSGLTFLADHQAVDGTRLGAVGYCLGGGLVLALGCADQRLQAIAPHYGPNPRPQAALARLCPVVGSYPANDQTASAGQALQALLHEAGIAHDIKIYPNTRHSFCNDERATYDKDAADDVWQRTVAFFDQHVRSAPLQPFDHQG